ncbi:MAG: DUF4843 domain-containing protein [Bacteroidales bacterium]|nr:DUF4843 domain-containing protein [Bacteroidales bacterium]MDD2426046.1 DUF4843 domain-containing protein [Bacteroidales bacterium]MDD3990294.1 DUF4843 domain-containing protein [Bacteroidales bacterium]MDD4639198.1 DUF4843 domain-containing protein [Bacteroidales bacterium]
MKIKAIKYSLSILAIIAGISSCQEKIVNKFEGESSLFFFRGSSNSKGAPQTDSVFYSFFLTESTKNEDTVWVDIMLTGLPSESDRVIPVVQTSAAEAGAAQAGVHYVAFDDPAFAKYLVLPANRVSVAFPVIVKRTPEMESSEFRLDMELTSNDHFIAGIKDRTKYSVKITAMAVKPALWDVLNSYLSIFGPWGQAKMKFIIDYVEYSDFDQVLTSDYRIYLALKAKAKLAEYEKANGPLYEADGVTRVTFP